MFLYEELAVAWLKSRCYVLNMDCDKTDFIGRDVFILYFQCFIGGIQVQQAFESFNQKLKPMTLFPDKRDHGWISLLVQKECTLLVTSKR